MSVIKEKLKAAQAAMSAIQQQVGPGSIRKLGERVAVQVPVIPTGSPSLDKALGCGGYPRGRVIEIFGPEASGKTTLTLHAIAEAQKAGGVAAFIDAEHAFDALYARRLGVDIDNLLAAKNAALGAAIALAVLVALALLHRWWKRRPKVVAPPPPPRPPWDVALEELTAVRLAELVQKGRYAEHFDRVSDAVRRYLGARYGFDGLETTTREALAALGRVSPRVPVFTEIQLFLEDADLVKFAKRTPEEAECQAVLEQAEQLVQRTMPVERPALAPRGPTP
jgi:hypothetical protein